MCIRLYKSNLKATYGIAKYYDVPGKKTMNDITRGAISLKILLMLYVLTQLLEIKIILDVSEGR